MNRIVLSLMVCILPLAAGPLRAQTPSCDDARVTTLLAKLRRELDTQEVHCTEAPRKADLDGDHHDDAVLLISYEGMGGGNNWGSWVYALLADPSKPPIPEPEETRGQAQSVEAIGNEIRISTLEYRDNDPRCCPSKEGSVRLRLVDGRLVRVDAR